MRRTKFNKSNLLHKILEMEERQAYYGSEASKLCIQYAEQFSEFKPGDKVRLHLWDNSIRYGIVEKVNFKLSTSFQYYILPTNSKFNAGTYRKAYYYYRTKENVSEIKKMEKVAP